MWAARQRYFYTKPVGSEVVSEAVGPSSALDACFSFQQESPRKPDDRAAEVEG